MADSSTPDSTGDGLATSDGGPAFLVGTCPDCDRVVLTARQLAADELIDVCVHCSRRLERGVLQLASAARVVRLGYAIDGFEDDECESHGGCRGGTCGVRQPGS